MRLRSRAVGSKDKTNSELPTAYSLKHIRSAFQRLWSSARGEGVPRLS